MDNRFKNIKLRLQFQYMISMIYAEIILPIMIIFGGLLMLSNSAIAFGIGVAIFVMSLLLLIYNYAPIPTNKFVRLKHSENKARYVKLDKSVRMNIALDFSEVKKQEAYSLFVARRELPLHPNAVFEYMDNHVFLNRSNVSSRRKMLFKMSPDDSFLMMTFYINFKNELVVSFYLNGIEIHQEIFAAYQFEKIAYLIPTNGNTNLKFAYNTNEVWYMAYDNFRFKQIIRNATIASKAQQAKSSKH